MHIEQSGRIGHGGAGRERGFLAFGHVADCKGYLHRIGSSSGEASALCRREMLAHDVDFFDGRAAGDQRGVKALKIFQCDAGIERLFDESGTAARDKEENQRMLVAMREAIQDCAAGCETFRCGYGVTADKCLPSRDSARRRGGNDKDAVQRKFGRKD